MMETQRARVHGLLGMVCGTILPQGIVPRRRCQHPHDASHAFQPAAENHAAKSRCT
ncbi:hypothetical protein B0T16DRAFT_410599 [Cercophora newfieldiana]|uniref:Uncharacterized protein n=1 Tax=Cercophora newfieldiana TaxID=92897 RepID=A0AA39YDW5_9PEZI|nr:hypothetical protein B0T16DRAFT_410599 [Cercophora newfieldiana]